MAKLTRKSEGFSLLEVLVAFVILSLSLSIILQIFSLSGWITRSSERQQQALLLAETKMAEIVAEKFIEPGRDEGDFAGRIAEESETEFRWRTEISAYEFQDEPPLSNVALMPYLIEVTVKWGDDGQSLSLSTIRLEAKI